MVENLAYVIGGTILGLLGAIYFFNGKGFLDIDKKKKEAEELIEKSKKEAEEILTETKEKVDHFKNSSETSRKNREERVLKVTEALKYKEETLAKKENRNQEIIKIIKEEGVAYKKMEQDLEHSGKNVLEELSAKTGLTVEDLRVKLLEEQRIVLERENVEKLSKMEELTKENAPRIAKKVLVNIIQRLCSPTSVERRAVLVKVPRENMKGKIIGRNGKNIEVFEELMPEVSIVFNDLPNTISLSCFNLVQRRIAQKAMEKLVRAKGDINIDVIKATLKESEKDVEEELYEIGKKAVDRMGFENMDKELIKIIGRLKYRTSYGQNIMKHSMEVAWVSSMLGSELGLDLNVCRVGGFLHDLGKAIDQDPNEKDAHDQLTKDLMERFGFSWEEVHAAWTHHDSIPIESPEALIVRAADAVSAGRPGARQESIFSYTERIKALEETARSFKGVDKVFTMSAGREVRMMVNTDEMGDKDLLPLAKEVAARVEDELAYPGKIKINVIRRIRNTRTARVKQ